MVMDEINVLKGLDHENIVHVWDHFESRDKWVAFPVSLNEAFSCGLSTPPLPCRFHSTELNPNARRDL